VHWIIIIARHTSAPIKDNKNRRFGLGARSTRERRERERRVRFGEGRQEEEEQKRLDAL
jgi:hypothetical protein